MLEEKRGQPEEIQEAAETLTDSARYNIFHTVEWGKEMEERMERHIQRLEEIEQEHKPGQLSEEDYERLKAMHEGMLGKR